MMIDEIDYCTFHEVGPNIMEIIVHEGVEINAERVKQTHMALYEKYNGPYAVLINRINAYSHTSGSLIKVSEQKNAVAFAIVTYSKASRIIATIHTLFQSNVRIFSHKSAAVRWLRSVMSEYIEQPA